MCERAVEGDYQVSSDRTGGVLVAPHVQRFASFAFHVSLEIAAGAIRNRVNPTSDPETDWTREVGTYTSL